MRDRYWHNMAGRIQRAFRNYMRYKHECARRIQRFWMSKKEAIVYAQKRERGHEVLAGRKERRRFSLLGYRRFMGDYLDVNGKSALGEELAGVCGLGCEWRCCRDPDDALRAVVQRIRSCLASVRSYWCPSWVVPASRCRGSSLWCVGISAGLSAADPPADEQGRPHLPHVIQGWHSLDDAGAQDTAGDHQERLYVEPAR
jgi:hypothetical protein